MSRISRPAPAVDPGILMKHDPSAASHKLSDKIGAAFVTAGDESGGKETTLMSIIQAFLIYGMIIVGDPLDATGHYGVACIGAPDKITLKNAIKLGRRVAILVKKLKE